MTEVASSSVSSFACSGDDEEAGASDTEVLVDDGDPGTADVSGAVEQTGIVVIISVAVVKNRLSIKRYLLVRNRDLVQRGR